MTNEYFAFGEDISPHTLARAQQIAAYLRAIALAFDKLPDPDALNQGSLGFGVATGPANAYVLTLDPAPTALAVGSTFHFQAPATNTGASTLNVNGLGATTIRDFAGNDLAPGMIPAGAIVTVRYDGTVFRLNSQVGAVIPLDGSVTTAKMADDAVTNAKLANMSEGTLKGRQAGVGTGDVQDLSATQAVGILAWAFLQTANNLSDLTNAAAARSNLGLGTAATANTGTGGSNVPTVTQADSLYLRKAMNLADAPDPAAARSALGLGTAATANTGTGAGDVPTTAQADARYVNVTGDTMTGALSATFLGINGQNAYLSADATNTFLVFDSGDYFQWIKSANEGGFALGSAFYRFDATGVPQDGNSVLRTEAADARYARLASAPTFSGDVTAPTFTITADGSNRIQQGAVTLRDTSPYVALRDTNNLGAIVFVDGGSFYVLRTPTDSFSGEQVNGRWPIQIDLSNNNALFGGDVNAITFTGNGASLTNVNAASVQGATINTAAAANTVAQRDGNGDITMRYALTEYAYMSHLPAQSDVDTRFASSTDQFVRWNTAAGMIASLGLDARYAPAGYNGSNGANLTFPLWETVMVIGSSVLTARAEARAIYLGTDARFFQFAVNGTPLTGTWRSRGHAPDDVTGNWAALMVRVA